MNILWKDIEDRQNNIINGWLSQADKYNLCMLQKSWKQTADDIYDCLKYMDNAQFKNIMGYINGEPVVALMFGIEQGEILNLYNIVVNPIFRNKGVAKNTLLKLINKDKLLNISKQYNQIIISAMPDNLCIHKLAETIGFNSLGFNGEYCVFEKCLSNENVRNI